MKLLFLIISFPVFSQSIFVDSINLIYVNNKLIEDIHSTQNNVVKPIKYLNIPVFSDLILSEKKQKFIDFILPAILIEKNKINKAYDYVINHSHNIDNNDTISQFYDYCNCDTYPNLLLCLKEQPNSIIIAQAAIESGWGTSRFFIEGNNLFGIHTNSKDLNKLQANNSSLVYVKKYNSISESISHYLRTLARGYAYEIYRKNRFGDIPVIELVNYLSMYSIRRESYIQDLKDMITYNNLLKYDTIELRYD